MKILIVEDTATDRLLLRSAVQYLGHECLVAASGAEGWELFGLHRPDVVISDWRMPGVDGGELCRRIRADEWSTYTPFIFVTGLTDREHALTGLEIGADDFLTKPLDIQELRVRLMAAARLKRAEGRVVEHTAALEAAVHELEAEVVERKLTERALRESELRLRTVISNAPVVLFAVDGTGTFTLFEGHGLSATGLDPGQLVGASALARRPGVPCEAEAIRRALAGESCTNPIESGGRVFDVHYSPILGADGIVAGAIGVAVDISDQRAVDKMKDEFISVVSHELRTPLTSIRGSLGLLQSGMLVAAPERAQRMLEIATSNADRLIRLTNDILDLERISSGQVTLEKTKCDPDAVLQEAVEAIRSLAEKAGVRLDRQAMPNLPRVLMDPHRIVQTLTNLIGNAIKFAPPGTTVTVGAECVDHKLVVRVADQGRGIPPDKVALIFERFQQVDVSDAREKGGTGLGLAICRSIIQQHGGKIWVDSEVGRGSTFCFTIPAS